MMEFLEYDMDFGKEMVELYVVEGKDDVRKMGEALQLQDKVEMMKTVQQVGPALGPCPPPSVDPARPRPVQSAHRMKGASGNLHLASMQRICEIIECTAKRGSVPPHPRSTHARALATGPLSTLLTARAQSLSWTASCPPTRGARSRLRSAPWRRASPRSTRGRTRCRRRRSVIDPKCLH